jgi:O-succinylbenzoate synthase
MNSGSGPGIAPGPVRAVDLFRVRMPLVRAFRTAHSTTTHKDALLVRVVTDDGVGWGECAAEAAPTYAAETLDTARVVLRDHLIPRTFAGVGFDDVRGNPFARAALDSALCDATLRAHGESLRSYLGGVRTEVDAGVAIGICTDEHELRTLATAYVNAGYRRLKCKIEPGDDVDAVRAVRGEVGDEITIGVDGNGSYAFDAALQLRALDEFGLQCIEQPLAPDALQETALLAAGLTTPVALDESITSAPVAETAIALGACALVNVKPGRVGGIAAARRVHDACHVQHVPLLIGGMLETGIGRAVNLAVASLPGFTQTGDCSASDRYFADDITEPFVLVDGRLRVPDGPGIGVEPRADRLRAYTIFRESFRR